MVHAEIGRHEKFTGDCIVVSTEWRDRYAIKEVPGSKYGPNDHRWAVPLSWPVCVALRGVFGEGLEVGPELSAWSQRDWAERIAPALAARQAVDLQPFGDTRTAAIEAWRSLEREFTLYPYQEAGVQFLATARRCMLNDDMGTGKTSQSVHTMRVLAETGEDPFPALVVCPNTVKHTWVEQFKLWWPDVEVTIPVGSAAKRNKAILEATGVVVLNWESLRLHSRLGAYGSIRIKRCWNCDPRLSREDKQNSPSRCEHCPKALNEVGWRTIIADEAHRMKDPKAKQTRALFATATDETVNRLTLTGTPIANNPMDLWPALHFIDPESWPSRQAYIDRYCQVSANPWGGITITGLRPDTRDEFFRAVDPRMRRMPKDVVLPFLPKKTFVTRSVEMSAKQQKAYEQMEQGMVAALEDGVVVAANPLVQLTRLVQFASAYATLDDDGHAVLSEPSCKLDALDELLEDLGQEPLVVFAQSRQLIDLAAKRLDKHGITYGKITGPVSAEERQVAINNFQNGHLRVMLCTLGAGGVGITLTRSPNLAFLQRSWSLVENNQAEDRVHRLGAEVHDKINIFDIVVGGTVEERLREAVAGKADLLEEYVRDKAFLARVLDAQEPVHS